MWSLAYGLVALALAAFVLMYAALHAPSLASEDIADQLYHAKKAHLREVRSLYALALVENSVYVKVVNASFIPPYPVKIQLGYSLWGRGRGGDVLFHMYAVVRRCRQAVSASGSPGLLLEADVRHLAEVPWLEVYAVVPRNGSELWRRLYLDWLRGGEPPSVLSHPELLERAKAEWALVRLPHGEYKLYALLPAGALGAAVVDYPAEAVLICPELGRPTPMYNEPADISPPINPPQPPSPR